MKRRQLFGYFLLFLTGCAAGTTKTDSNNANSTISNFPEKLRFTVTDAQGLKELQRDYGSLQTALEEVLQKKIEFFPVESYTAAVAALQLDQVDLVFTGPSEYVIMRARTNAVPVIAVTRPNYHTVICVRKNSKIKSVANLKGKKLAIWKVGSTSGHLGPTKLVIDAGLDPKSDLKMLMLASKGLSELQKGEVDAWGGSAVKYQKFLQDNSLSESDLPTIAKGPELPNDLFVVNSKMSAAFVQEISDRFIKNQDKLLQSLLSVEEGKYKGAKLIAANDYEYNMVRQVYQAIGQGEFIQ